MKRGYDVAIELSEDSMFWSMMTLRSEVRLKAREGTHQVYLGPLRASGCILAH